MTPWHLWPIELCKQVRIFAIEPASCILTWLIMNLASSNAAKLDDASEFFQQPFHNFRSSLLKVTIFFIFLLSW